MTTEYADGPPPPEEVAMPCKISLKTFAEDTDGWIVHVSIDAEDMARGLTMFNGLVQRMKADGYSANKGFENKVTHAGKGGRKPPWKKPEPEPGALTECPNCGGAVWDNRKKKRDGLMNPKAPDFSCKDKEDCQWVQWPDRNGD